MWRWRYVYQVYGHKNVSLLNGGLPAWKAAEYAIDSGPVPSVERSDYPYALPDKSMVKGTIICPRRSCDCSSTTPDASFRSMYTWITQSMLI